MVWWNVPAPDRRNATFADLIEENPTSVPWHTAPNATMLIAMMSPVNQAKLEAAKRAGRRMVGGVYKRTRLDEHGAKVQRAEVRFDDVAGCLRTPAGGSSRQVIIVVDGKKVRSRLISSRETARLMGLDDEYSFRRTTTRPTTSPATASPSMSCATWPSTSSNRCQAPASPRGRRVTVIPCERDASSARRSSASSRS